MIMEGKVTECGKQLTERGEPIEAARWGITPRQLQKLEARFRTRDDPNLCVGSGGAPPRLGFVAKCIEPNYNRGRGVALTYNDPNPKPITLMISHCWSEPVSTFFRDVLITTIDTPDAGMFICFLSLYQGTERELNAQVNQNSTNMEDGCFWQVLESVKRQAGRMIVVSNKNEMVSGRGLYSRLWCTWEVWCAVQQDVAMHVHPLTGTETHLFGSRGKRGFAAQEGRCGREHDARQIKAGVRSWKRIDNAILQASEFTTITGEVSAAGLRLSNAAVAKLMLAIAEEELQPRILNLDQNELQEAETVADFLKVNASVDELYLNTCHINNLGIQALGDALSANTTLQTLDLRNNSIADIGAQALADALSANTTLRMLYLIDNSIPDIGAQALADALRANTTLRTLYLCRNSIADIGAQALAGALSANTTVEQLGLGENSITDIGAQALAGALHANTTLRYLGLEGNSITDIGAEALKNRGNRNCSVPI
eukprot:NODE_185_length_1846_cov_559.426577.p1 GENE.NODE_185_length_1846_cov_559.426577~~NODE_185_length_1846_cov_559.426577.p1  ORF type:complete len:514 (-),score=139.04 NODE_185_length_1846_cov_559.426577:287-1744(-)